MDKTELLKEAIKARENAYAPYSKFAVGAALLTKSGKLYRGCNIENASYPATNCAERTAFFKAVSEGEREFEAIAIAGGPAGKAPEDLCAPCGICRQVMMEFCDPATFLVILGTGDADVCTYTLQELLPLGFGPKNLENC
jgi:cytidine deaminase